MLNGFPLRIAENEVLGFNDVQCVYPTVSVLDCTVQ